MKKYSVLLLLLFHIQAYAQSIPLVQGVQERVNYLAMEADSTIFTGYRSMDWLELKGIPGLQKKTVADSTFGLSANQRYKSAFSYLGNNNWVQWGGPKSLFAIDPYIEAAGGKTDAKDGMLLQGALGLRMQGVVNDKISFGAGFYANLTEFPSYVDQRIVSRSNVIPGQGIGTLKNKGRYSYSRPDLYFTYQPGKHFLVTAGYGKQFIGDGYRSLFLSDNSFNYPYVRLQTRFWKFTYNVLYSRYNNLREIDGSKQGKYSTTHYLGMNIGKKLQVAVFENIIWVARDTNYHRGFDVQYLNPIIFLRPVEFTVGSPDNAMLGFTWKYKLYKKGYIYGQVGLDDLNFTASLDSNKQHLNNKYFIQLGIWNKDIFNVEGLSWRFEWNTVRPYTYGHRKPEQNYTHYGQALADPFDANFHELISIFRYSKNRWFGSLENLYAIRGENPGLPYNNGEDLWGGEAGVPLFGSRTLQGIKNKYFFSKLSAGYLLNPKNRLSLQADLTYRKHSNPQASASEFIFSFGIRTDLFNSYQDF